MNLDGALHKLKENIISLTYQLTYPFSKPIKQTLDHIQNTSNSQETNNNNNNNNNLNSIKIIGSSILSIPLIAYLHETMHMLEEYSVNGEIGKLVMPDYLGGKTLEDILPEIISSMESEGLNQDHIDSLCAYYKHSEAYQGNSLEGLLTTLGPQLLLPLGIIALSKGIKNKNPYLIGLGLSTTVTQNCTYDFVLAGGYLLEGISEITTKYLAPFGELCSKFVDQLNQGDITPLSIATITGLGIINLSYRLFEKISNKLPNTEI